MADFAEIQSLAAKGKATRREFIQLALASGITVAAADTLFTEVLAQTPKRAGKLKIALGHGSTTDSLDPATYPDQYTGTVCWGSMSNSLTEVDAKGNIVGDLAESMESSDRANRWVFKLRKGLTFHNGKSVTADDVVASYRHHMGAESKSAAKSLLNAVEDIKAEGPGSVVFTLKGANADFPYIVSDYHLPIMPSADGKVDWQSGIRTGPFALVKFEPGVKTTLKRNPNYHKSGRPYFDEMEVLSIADVTARTNALTTGEIQFMDRCDLKTLSRLEQNPNIKILEVTGYGHYVVPMNVTVKPFDNLDVRLALKYAMDREDILKKVFLGHGAVGNDNPIAPVVKFAIDPKPKHAYDPEKVKFHLKKAGLSMLKVDLSAADAAFAGAVDSAVLYQAHAAKAGIDINVIREPNDGYWDNVWMKKPWCMSYWNGRPTVDWMMTTAYAAEAAWNDTFWNHRKFNQLLVAARSEADDKKRSAMYSEMQQILHDDGGLIVMLFNSYVNAHSNKLAHGPVASNWDVDGMKIGERWWLA